MTTTLSCTNVDPVPIAENACLEGGACNEGYGGFLCGTCAKNWFQLGDECKRMSPLLLIPQLADSLLFNSLFFCCPLCRVYYCAISGVGILTHVWQLSPEDSQFTDLNPLLAM